MKWSLLITVCCTAAFAANAQVNVTQKNNNPSRDGLYIDAAFTPPNAASLVRDLNFNGTIVGNVHAQPLYIEGGPNGAMIIAVTASNNIYALNATTGWDVSLDETIDVGHRAIILQSVFGTQRGWIAEHDWQDVGPRFLEPIPDGKYQGFTIAKWLPELIYEYYRISGRHEKTGRPYLDTLQKLGLEEFSQWSQLD